ncbi:MAG: 3-oxoacyl-[acyl-carrier-protein] reductase [Candidatus Dasytiphilus stammeri]
MKEKVALVTGANRGIGRAIAETLAIRGMIVAGTATDIYGVDIINTFLIKNGGKGFILDITNLTSIQTVLKSICSELGEIDILINNIGITQDNILIKMKPSEWQQVIDVNLSSIFYLSKAVIKTMIKKHAGRIINIGSMIGSSGNKGQTNYAATKSGIIGFSKSLALEVASRGITVNVIAPGFIETDMTTKVFNNTETRAEILNKIPMGRFGTPQEIANAVVFLASDEAAYITGETLHINGGMYMF